MSKLGIAAACIFACAAVEAQVVLHSDVVASAGLSSRTLVKDSFGLMYCVSIQESAGSNSVALRYSADGGATWNLDPFVFNDASSGQSGAATTLTNNCAVAIDDQDTLHVTWAAYYYPSNYRQYYRSFNFYTQIASAIVNINTVTGAAVTARTQANDIVVDGNNDVWIAAHGPSSWVELLLKSTNPYAAGGTFTSLGAISPSASAQTTRLAVDALGTIHCAFYRNTGNGNYEHRAYVPGTGWSASTVVGNTTPSQDYYGNLAADVFGNLHCIYAKDSGANTTWVFAYRMRDINGVWSAEIPIYSATVAQYTGIANYFTFAAACDEGTGVVSIFYRDISTNGALRVAHKTLTDAAFKTLPNDLTVGSVAAHEYYLPTIRGSLFPVSNRTGAVLDMTWQWRPVGGTFTFMFDRLDTAVQHVPAGLPIGVSTPVVVQAGSQPFAPFACAFSGANTPPILLPDGRAIPLFLDALVTFSLDPLNGIFIGSAGVLDGSGLATVIVNTPPIPALVGFTLYTSFITADGAYPSGVRSISAEAPLVIL